MALAELRDRPVFICGHPKAGTSLLRALLDAHPQVVVYPEESVFFRRYLPKADGLALQDQQKLAVEELTHIFTWNQEDPPPSQDGFPDRDYSAIAHQHVQQAMAQLLASLPPRHTGDMLSAAVLAYGQVTGQLSANTHAWVEKSPYNEKYAGQIFTWWPQARCIHMVRDPRDNFVSYRRKHPDWSAEFFARNWRSSLLAGFANQVKYGASQYLLLRYEDLVQSPEPTLQQIIKFLGIKFDKILKTPTRAGIPWQGNSMFAQEFEVISAAPVGRWKSTLTSQEAAVIEWIARQAMVELQYEHSLNSSLYTRVNVALWPLRRRVAKIFHRVTPGKSGEK
ncbi:MAG: sulfotransferase [Anaerolineae bacterium]|nr:sulfotransferase [Anaerolineae bacterium]